VEIRLRGIVSRMGRHCGVKARVSGGGQAGQWAMALSCRAELPQEAIG
jgi:hypothetical protein